LVNPTKIALVSSISPDNVLNDPSVTGKESMWELRLLWWKAIQLFFAGRDFNDSQEEKRVTILHVTILQIGSFVCERAFQRTG
jgi:hypothetical protein